MQALCNQSAEEYAAQYVGQTVSVLLETPYSDDTIDGHTDTYLTVMVKTNKPEGTLLPVRITHCKGDTLFGEETL